MGHLEEYRLLSTSGLLGYGFPEASLKAGLARDPHLIGVDGGSTDPGPYYLGSGKPQFARCDEARHLRLMLSAAMSQRVPLIIGSCGGAGESRTFSLSSISCASSPASTGTTSKWPSSTPSRRRTRWLNCDARCSAAAAQLARIDETVEAREPHRRHDGRGAVHARAG